MTQTHKPHNTFLLAHTYTHTLSQLFSWPVHIHTPAAAGKTFFAMNIVKSRMQNRMGDEWLNNCLVTYIKRYFCWYWKWENRRG